MTYWAVDWTPNPGSCRRLIRVYDCYEEAATLYRHLAKEGGQPRLWRL